MQNLRTCFVAAIALSAAFAFPRTVAAAATTSEVLALMAKSEYDTKTFEADTKTTIGAGDQKIENTGHVARQSILRDGKLVGHLMNTKQLTKMEQTAIIQLMVNDGEFLWTETRTSMDPGAVVVKSRADASAAPSSDKADPMKDSFELKLAGEETLNGQKMWVLEGRPQPGKAPAGEGSSKADQEFGKFRTYIGQNDIQCHRMVGFDKDGNVIMDTRYTNIRVNEKIDPAVFKYTPPRGALIQDMTQDAPAAPAPTAP